MESLTKNKQSEETIRVMVNRAFGENSVKHIQELKEGFFNVAYEVELVNGKSVILKIAPKPESLIMSYEKNIMFSEVDSMKLVAQNTDLPVPKIYYYDNSHEVCTSDYFFMEKITGKSLAALSDELEPDVKAKLMMEIGKMNAKINGICGKKFGYYGQPDMQGEEWYGTFCMMVELAFADALKLGIDLKVSKLELLERLEKDKQAFMEVKTPRLVHWDLWAGNIFVKDGQITGIIDFERCLWGDELMEVGFRTYGSDDDFLRGYRHDKLTPNEKIRARWYDIYLFLLVGLEYDYRHYDSDESYVWATEMLTQYMKNA